LFFKIEETKEDITNGRTNSIIQKVVYLFDIEI